VINADGSTGGSTDGHVEVGALALGIALIVPSLTGPARYPAAA
jgi:hypothetical protein